MDDYAKVESFEGFERWYRSTWAKLVAALALVDGDLETAADAADEAFAKAAAHWPRVKAMDNPAGWVYQVGVNLQRRRLRREAVERRLLHLHRVGDRFGPVEPDLLVAVRDSIAGLPRRQRVAIVLTYFADLSQREVAEAMGVTRATVASTLSHARAALANSLKEHR